MKDTLVSIVVPFFNVEKYLFDCLNSLKGQTYSNIEVIMVNDGSTDKSGNIADEFADTDIRFHHVKKENGGVSSARNTGIENAHGKYIYYLDSDDYLETTAIEELVEYAENNTLDIIKFEAKTFTDQKELEWYYESYSYKGDYPAVCSGNNFLKIAIKSGDVFFANCNHIFTRREVLEANNLKFIEGIIHEDIIYIWQLYALSERVGVYNKKLHNRRYRPGSIMHTVKWEEKIYAMLVSIDAGYNFIKKYNLYNEVSRWYIRLFPTRVLQHWIEMTNDERLIHQIKEMVNQLRKTIFKHLYLYKLNLIIFGINPRLYDVYHKIVMKINNC